MTIDKTINIIGGGISGLTTSLAFKTNGINHNLYEKNSEITYENVGFGISAVSYTHLDVYKRQVLKARVNRFTLFSDSSVRGEC